MVLISLAELALVVGNILYLIALLFRGNLGILVKLLPCQFGPRPIANYFYWSLCR